MPETLQPSYMPLYESGELARRVAALESLLEACTVCPLDCGNNRLKGELARCFSGALPVVSSYTPHFGEEPALVGARGAGNIFFGNCNRRNEAFRYNTLQGEMILSRRRICSPTPKCCWSSKMIPACARPSFMSSSWRRNEVADVEGVEDSSSPAVWARCSSSGIPTSPASNAV